jgi:hypothetical protein
MGKNDSKVQTEPGDTVAPQQTETLGGKSSVELLALAGDENARRALGQPTTAQLAPARAVPNGQDGFEVGNTAPESVYETLGGRIVRVAAGETPDGGQYGFRGTLLVAAGDVVTGAAAARIAQG